jgi:hypothetical protein
MDLEREQPEAIIKTRSRDERTETPKILDMRLDAAPYCDHLRDAGLRRRVVKRRTLDT